MKTFRCVFIFIQLLVFCQLLNAQVSPVDSLKIGGKRKPGGAITKIAPNDSLANNNDSASLSQNPVPFGDSIPKTSAAKPKNSGVDTTVSYSATDSIVFDMQSKTLVLFKNGELKYQDITLKADSISVDFDKNTLYAAGLADSTGKIVGIPDFKQADQIYKAQRVAFNFKTRKGKVSFARSKQEDNYVLGSEAKLAGLDANGKDIIYIKNGAFTACDAEEPHYHIRSRKLKIMPNDRIISGPLMFVVDRFPLPIVLPFGFFPNKPGKRSGLILPQYGEDLERGFFLKGLGFYWAVNDFLAIKMISDIYTRGGYQFGLSVDYNARYKLNGALDVSYSLKKTGEKYEEVPNKQRIKDFYVSWNHAQNISPSTKLSGNVKIGSSDYLKNNSYNTQEAVQAKLNSSVNLQTGFFKRRLSMSVNLDHDQNTQTKTMTLGLPTINMSLARLTPFNSIISKKSEALSILTNLGFSYGLNAKNSITAPDSLIFGILANPTREVSLIEIEDEDTTITTQQAFDFFRNGVKQSVPISTKITIGKFFSFSPSFNYNEYWYFRRRYKEYYETIDTVSGARIANDRDINEYGFYTMRDYNTGVETSTNLYGFYSIKGDSAKGRNEMTVRHTLTPRLSFTYKPDFGQPKYGIYDYVQSDTLGNTRLYNRYKDTPFGTPSTSKTGRISFSINNNLELKYKPKEKKIETDSLTIDSLAQINTLGFTPEETDDEGEEKKLGKGGEKKPEDMFKKITLLEQLSLNTGYNLLADSLKLDPFALSARSNLFNNMLGIQVGANFDPYAFDSTGRPYDKFLWEAESQLVRLTRFTVNLSTGLTGKNKDPKKRNLKRPPAYLLLNDLYQDPNIPWTANVALNLNYTDNGVDKDTTLNIMMSGNFKIGKNWSIDFSTGLNIIKKELTVTTFSFNRNLHCWNLRFSWTPFGPLKSYLFSINATSKMLKDLKIQKQDRFSDNFNF